MQLKKRGRPEGSKKKVSPEIRQMLGDATLHYAHGRYEEVKVFKLTPLVQVTRAWLFV